MVNVPRSLTFSRALVVALLALVTRPVAAEAIEPARVAFEHDGGVLTVDASGGERRRVLDGRSPAFSPDGRSIAFVRDRARSALWVAGADGSNPRRVAVAGFLLGSPAWSPDGSRLAFVQAGYAKDKIVTSVEVVSADGTGRRTVRALRQRLRFFDAINAVAFGPGARTGRPAANARRSGSARGSARGCSAAARVADDPR